MGLLYFIYDALIDGYFYVVALLLLSYWLIKKQRTLLKEIIVSSNILSLLMYFMFICNALYILYPIIQTFNDERDIFFKYRIAGPYHTYFWIPFINGIIIFILLLFNKTRNFLDTFLPLPRFILMDHPVETIFHRAGVLNILTTWITY